MTIQSIPIKVNLTNLKASCSACTLHELCLPMGLSLDDTELVDKIINNRRKFFRGDYLYRAGDSFRSLYAIRNGFFKMSELAEDGCEKITGFYMAGELLGMDAISDDRHHYHVVALEDSMVCEIPFADLEHLTTTIPALQHHFHKIMSREIMADQDHMLLLSKMKAEQRLAAFLLNLSQRLGSRGYSPTHFYLRMTREEIGNYLGLTLETISRTFTHFQQEGLMTVHHRDVELHDPLRLKGMLNHY
jgi:CRP/FNR family transcriptional regulator